MQERVHTQQVQAHHGQHKAPHAKCINQRGCHCGLPRRDGELTLAALLTCVMTYGKSWLRYAVAGVCSHPSANLSAPPPPRCGASACQHNYVCGSLWLQKVPCKELTALNKKTGFVKVICEVQEEQFEETCALVREVGFDRVNTAAYSPRPNTPAAVWENQIADLIKADRLNRLNRIANEVAEERAQRFVGAVSEVTSLLQCMACAHMCCA